jgi:hypothetical protein
VTIKADLYQRTTQKALLDSRVAEMTSEKTTADRCLTTMRALVARTAEETSLATAREDSSLKTTKTAVTAKSDLHFVAICVVILHADFMPYFN